MSDLRKLSDKQLLVAVVAAINGGPLEPGSITELGRRLGERDRLLAAAEAVVTDDFWIGEEDKAAAFTRLAALVSELKEGRS